MVLALAGDSTMTRSCLYFVPFPAVVAGALLALPALLVRLVFRAAGAAFLRPVASGVPFSVGCFLRAATAVSLLLLCALDQSRYNHYFERSPPFTHTIALRRVSSPAAGRWSRPRPKARIANGLSSLPPLPQTPEGLPGRLDHPDDDHLRIL